MAFVVVKQRDVARGDDAFAEWSDCESFPVGHRTKKGAEAAARRLVPEGADPYVYGNYRVYHLPQFVGVVLDD